MHIFFKMWECTRTKFFKLLIHSDFVVFIHFREFYYTKLGSNLYLSCALLILLFFFFVSNFRSTMWCKTYNSKPLNFNSHRLRILVFKNSYFIAKFYWILRFFGSKFCQRIVVKVLSIWEISVVLVSRSEKSCIILLLQFNHCSSLKRNYTRIRIIKFRTFYRQ